MTTTVPGLVVGALLLLAFGAAPAQTGTPEECKANECFSPAFDVGVLVQSPVGHYGITELMFAVEMNDLDKVKALLSAGAEVNARNDGGATALLMAAAYGSAEIVDRLLAAGADPNIGTEQGETPLASAIQFNRPDIAVALLEHGANPNVYHSPNDPRFRKGALTRAAVLGQTDVVSLLLKLGVDVQESGLEALSLALWKRHEDIVELLLDSDIDLNTPTYDAKQHAHMQTGEYVLHTAAQQGLERSTALLLENGADVNKVGARGHTALFFAARENHAEVVNLLLNEGALVSADAVAIALDAGNGALAEQLATSLDVSALKNAEIDSLITRADKTNSTAFLERLFREQDLRGDAEPVTTLLFAKAGTDDCELVRWDRVSGHEDMILSRAGPCGRGFFFSRPRSELYVVEGDEISVVSLDAPNAEPRRVALPTAMIEENLAALKARLSVVFDGHDASWMKAEIVQAGILDSGELAFVTHSNGPADGTYGYLYALSGNTWRLVRNEDCHRFDTCRFEDVLSHSMHDRPNGMTAWSPGIRRNPHFVDKSESRVIHYEDVSWDGVVALDIDGQRSVLSYSKTEGGHCFDDCMYTAGLTLELPGQDAVTITKVSGNNAIVDRYALVWTGYPARSELIDLGTGESVFGELQIASWLH